ncbi:MAG: response regulator [Candidatus Levybacteria bacterium]|nr:response regulator [Candidatus Levybacteria bacterium]
MADGPKTEARLPSKEKVSKSKINVLIVEDEPSVLLFVTRAISMFGGYKTISTDSTVGALNILRESQAKNQPVDLILSDLGLTDNPAGGFEIANAAKSEQLAKYFILFTGRAGDIRSGNTQEQLKEKGIDSIADKPISINDLKDTLNKGKEAIESAQVSQ